VLIPSPLLPLHLKGRRDKRKGKGDTTLKLVGNCLAVPP